MKRLLLILPVALLAVAVATSAPAPKPGQPLKTKINPKDGAKMVYVPPGEFLMGTDKAELDAIWQRLGWKEEWKRFAKDEVPMHRVRLTKSYWLYQTEVTNAMYGHFLAATGYQKPSYWGKRRFGRPKQPVVGVSWHDAVAYCKWAGGRLPTEAEWEYAAAGTDGRKYPWGNEAPDKTRAVFDLAFKTGRARPVGRLVEGASPFGARDMAGNVYEWCADRYGKDYYGQSPAADPKGPAKGKARVLRGGSWGSIPSNLRVTSRVGYLTPGFRDFLVGFRAARTAD